MVAVTGSGELKLPLMEKDYLCPIRVLLLNKNSCNSFVPSTVAPL